MAIWSRDALRETLPPFELAEADLPLLLGFLCYTRDCRSRCRSLCRCIVTELQVFADAASSWASRRLLGTHLLAKPIHLAIYGLGRLTTAIVGFGLSLLGTFLRLALLVLLERVLIATDRLCYLRECGGK